MKFFLSGGGWVYWSYRVVAHLNHCAVFFVDFNLRPSFTYGYPDT